MIKKIPPLNAIAIVFAAAVLFFFAAGIGKTPNVARASSGDALSGYAWSETIGWISFNCTTDPGGCGSSDYGVNVDTNGNFSGYAWSENVGWISFTGADLAGCPHAPCSATFNASTNQAQGWARALAANSPASPGWDGWISLNCATDGAGCGTSNYAVSYNAGAKQFQGFAWGSDVVGWVSFNCSDTSSCGTSNYHVDGNVNTPPTLSGLTADPASSATYCGVPSQHVHWTFSDAQDGSTQSAYQLQVDNNSDFSSPAFDSGKVSSSSTSIFVPVSVSPGANQLAFNTTYYWRVQAYDSGNLSSGWNTGPSFATPKHPYPQPNFTWSPTSPSQGQKVNFTDQTIFAAGSVNHAWAWSISNATYVDGTSSTSQNPHVRFGSQQNVSVSLTASDDVGSCTYPGGGPLTITVKPPIPQFREVQP